jgi:hypothetical protein
MQAHPGTVSDGASGIPVIGMTRNMGFEMEAIRTRNVMVRISTLNGRLRPPRFRIGKIMFSVEWRQIANDLLSNCQLNVAFGQERIEITVHNMLMVEPYP